MSHLAQSKKKVVDKQEQVWYNTREEARGGRNNGNETDYLLCNHGTLGAGCAGNDSDLQKRWRKLVWIYLYRICAFHSFHCKALWVILKCKLQARKCACKIASKNFSKKIFKNLLTSY